MNTLKMSPVGQAVSGAEGSRRSPVDCEAQQPRAAHVVAHGARELPVGLAEPSPRPQTHAKPKPCRAAIKVGGKILFIHLCDVVSVQAKGNCVWPRVNT